MNKMIHIQYSQKNNPHGMLVELYRTVDGVEWSLVFATRVTQGKYHNYSDKEYPDTYIHLEILNRINEFIRLGYQLVE